MARGTGVVTMGNVTLGAGAGIADFEPNGTTLNIGSVTIATSVAYFSSGFADLERRRGPHRRRHQHRRQLLADSQRQRSDHAANGDVMFSSGFSSGGVGVVVLNAACNLHGRDEPCASTPPAPSALPRWASYSSGSTTPCRRPPT